MSANYLKQGSWNAICDRCGFKFKSDELRKTWDGLYVCKDDWEPRHPQDFVKGKEDKQSVPWTRPDSNADTSVTRVDGNSLSTDNTVDTVGDADKTLTAGTDHTIQIWNTTLTADRTITLNAASNGDRFVIYRTGGGAFDLIIGSVKTTGIKSKTTIEYNGSAWALIDYTPLGL